MYRYQLNPFGMSKSQMFSQSYCESGSDEAINVFDPAPAILDTFVRND